MKGTFLGGRGAKKRLSYIAQVLNGLYKFFRYYAYEFGFYNEAVTIKGGLLFLTWLYGLLQCRPVSGRVYGMRKYA